MENRGRLADVRTVEVYMKTRQMVRSGNAHFPPDGIRHRLLCRGKIS